MCRENFSKPACDFNSKCPTRQLATKEEREGDGRTEKQGEGNNGDKETKDKMIHGILVVLSIFIFSKYEQIPPCPQRKWGFFIGQTLIINKCCLDPNPQV